MATISGFGAEQLSFRPQTFQALSLGGGAPQPPVQPYGTPNQNLVPVNRNPVAVLPANLTLAAQPAFHALLKVNSTVLAAGNPDTGDIPNSTAGVDAKNPGVNLQVQGPGTTASAQIATAPQGEVSFTLTQAPAYVTSGLNALQKTLANDPPPVAPPPSQTATQSAQSSQGSSSTTSTQSAQSTQTQQPAPRVVTSAPSFPPSSTPQYVQPSSPGLIARIVQTVTSLAASAIYPAPIFSFSA